MTRHLSAIFCDDIRQEMGNKMSFMGCYEGELIVASAPALLSKLCIYASAWTKKGHPFKALSFRVVQNDTVELAKLEIPTDSLAQAMHVEDATATGKKVSTAIVFSPFFIEKPSWIRLFAATEEGEIIGPRLLIKVAEVMDNRAVPNETPQAVPARKRKVVRK